MRRQLKKSVVYGLYGTSFTMLVGGIALLGFATTKNVEKPDYDYVSKGMLDYEENVKVVNTSDTIAKPYTDTEISIVKSYYDYKDEAEKQEKALIYYEGTYMQSSGVAYSKGSAFDVTSVLPGKVKEVKEDTTLGNVIIIEHENGITSTYQSISDIKVKKGDEVTSGQIIAKSSTSNISTELENHLYFELIINGSCVNPESYYGKSVNEI